jgi:hypothetical protein
MSLCIAWYLNSESMNLEASIKSGLPLPTLTAYEDLPPLLRDGKTQKCTVMPA